VEDVQSGYAVWAFGVDEGEEGDGEKSLKRGAMLKRDYTKSADESSGVAL